MNSPRVLVVDDETNISFLVASALRLADIEVEVAATAREALTTTEAFRPDALVLDVMLPDLDGFDVLQQLRARGHLMPVLFLTARTDTADRVRGLTSGGDDYITKPFALEELLARLRALMRRADPTASDSTLLEFEDLTLDPATRDVKRGGREIELTKTEFSLLELFLNHPRQVLSRTQIFEAVWEYDFGPSSNALEVYVGYLRRKTESDGEPRLIQTIRGVGYTLREP